MACRFSPRCWPLALLPLLGLLLPGCFSNKQHQGQQLYAAQCASCHGEQGQGLGVHLIEAVENAARAAGGQFLDLNVNRYNPAIAFYERRGFARHSEVDVPIGPYFMNDYIMRKAL